MKKKWWLNPPTSHFVGDRLPKIQRGDPLEFFLEKNGFSFLRSQKIRKNSLIPAMYNTWSKYLRKGVKKVKICHFLINLVICPKNSVFWIFIPFFSSIWPLESVIFFWFFETLKKKIHFFFQRVPPLDLEESVTNKMAGRWI